MRKYIRKSVSVRSVDLFRTSCHLFVAATYLITLILSKIGHQVNLWLGLLLSMIIA